MTSTRTPARSAARSAARIPVRTSPPKRSQRPKPVDASIFRTPAGDDYLERILRARVYEVAMQTPLELASNLSRRIGNRVLLKREDMQPVFSFKLRGAYNKMAQLSTAQDRKSTRLNSSH